MVNPEDTEPAAVVDKHGVLESSDALWLDLGCGTRKAGPHYVGVDVLDAPEVDIVGDVMVVLDRIRAGAVARVHASHFFEHVADVPLLLTKLSRAIAPGGELDVIVPHFSNPYYYSDLTHRSFFGLYSFSYFAAASPFKRKVPNYGLILPFRLVDVELRFKSAPPFYGRHAIKRAVQVAVNSSRGAKEFYEENLCYLLPCYELRYRLVRE